MAAGVRRMDLFTEGTFEDDGGEDVGFYTSRLLIPIEREGQILKMLPAKQRKIIEKCSYRSLFSRLSMTCSELNVAVYGAHDAEWLKCLQCPASGSSRQPS